MQIPTSLLAMVDSSVGGKVGVDLPQGKNLVGAFKQPDAVLIDPDVLETLPEREWRCGAAEVDQARADRRSGLARPALTPDGDAVAMVARAVQVKVDVVQQDPYEQNVRAYLNLGHTFAHAVEQVSGYQWLHGEAVGFGLVAAARLSAALGMIDAEFGGSGRGDCQALSDCRCASAISTRRRSTRRCPPTRSGRAGIRVSCCWKAFGKPMIVEDVPAEQVIEVLSDLRGA